MFKTPGVATVGLVAMIAAGGQLPGDRPASNPRATRSVVMARNGLIATSQPLASAAGLRVLQQGGNAIDAAVTAAAVLAVVEPTMNGLGGDLFALVHDPKTMAAYARSTPAGGRRRRQPPAEFKRRRLDEIPYRGELSVSVPGVVDGWSELLADARHDHAGASAGAGDPLRTGRVRRERDHLRAVEGRRAHPRSRHCRGGDLSSRWQGACGRRRLPQPASRRHARAIAKGGRDAFYRGAIAQGYRRRHEAAQRPDDRSGPGRAPVRLADSHLDELSRLRRPRIPAEHARASTALQMLNLLEAYDLKALGHNSAAYLHLLVEAEEDRVRRSQCLAC